MRRERDFRKVKRIIGYVPSLEAIYLNDSDKGVWMFHPHLDGLMVHAFMTFQIRGKRAVESLQNALKWVLDSTAYRNVYAAVPRASRHAGFLAVWAGMVFTHEESGMRYYTWAG